MVSESDEDDVSLFRKAMSDVNTEHQNYRQRRNNPIDNRPRPSVRLSRKAAVGKSPVAKTDAPENRVDETEDSDSAQFARSGLQKNIVRRLKRGQYKIESTLDLHGLRAFEAEDALDTFISDALSHRFTCVLIIHGKGLQSANKKGVLKQYTLKWLKQIAAVKAFCTAQPRHGGTGAVYVLLKTPAVTRLHS